MTTDEWRNALDSLEHRLQRELRRTLEPMAETLKDIKHEVQTTNGRVSRLEEDRIRRDAADGVRAELAKQAVEVAATKAAEIVHRREWGVRKLTVVIAACGLGFTILATLGGLIAHMLNH